MRVLVLIVALGLLFMGAVWAADDTAPSGPPSAITPPDGRDMPRMPKPGRTVPIGPKDFTSFARRASGSVTVVAAIPPELQVAEVEFQIDEKSLGSVTAKPFTLTFETTTVTDGEHTLKAIARDDSGSQVWSAITKVKVENNAPSNSDAPAVPSAQPDAPMIDNAAADVTGSKSPATGAAPVGSPALDKTYSSENYGFSIKYPGTWSVQDVSGGDRKANGEFWITLGEKPIDSALVVFNVHGRNIQPTTTADIYARYNSFVLTWERKTINGRPAFVTSSPGENGGAVHRAIIITKGKAWMFNLTATAAGATPETGKLFEDMLNSFKPNAL